MNAAALELADVRSGYGEAVVVHDVTLEIQRGEIFVLLGKNGMGKSTLLKTIMGFLPKLGGSVKLFGEEIGARRVDVDADVLGACEPWRVRPWPAADIENTANRLRPQGSFGGGELRVHEWPLPRRIDAWMFEETINQPHVSWCSIGKS